MPHVANTSKKNSTINAIKQTNTNKHTDAHKQSDSQTGTPKEQMQIDIDQRALGNGLPSQFYAANDYILSSFDVPNETKHFKKIEIPTVSLATVVKEKNPTAIFCDIEGAENEFLPPEDLQNVDKVIIELHPSHYGVQGVQQIKDRFVKHGFTAVEQRQDTHCFLRN